MLNGMSGVPTGLRILVSVAVVVSMVLVSSSAYAAATIDSTPVPTPTSSSGDGTGGEVSHDSQTDEGADVPVAGTDGDEARAVPGAAVDSQPSPRRDKPKKRKKKLSSLMGYVEVGGKPVKNATIVLRRKSGKKVPLLKGNKTDRFGMFHVATTRKVPQGFIITARGGKSRGKKNKAKLHALGRLNEPGQMVNPVTTIAAKYHKRHRQQVGKISFRKANRAVAKYLQLPTPPRGAKIYRLGQAALAPTTNFDPTRLNRLANKNGGLNKYTTKVARQVLKKRTQDFRPKVESRPIAPRKSLEESIEEGVTGLVKSALESAANWAVCGSSLSKVYILSTIMGCKSSNQTIASMVKEILDELSSMSAELSELSGEVAELLEDNSDSTLASLSSSSGFNKLSVYLADWNLYQTLMAGTAADTDASVSSDDTDSELCTALFDSSTYFTAPSGYSSTGQTPASACKQLAKFTDRFASSYSDLAQAITTYNETPSSSTSLFLAIQDVFTSAGTQLLSGGDVNTLISNYDMMSSAVANGLANSLAWQTFREQVTGELTSGCTLNDSVSTSSISLEMNTPCATAISLDEYVTVLGAMADSAPEAAVEQIIVNSVSGSSDYGTAWWKYAVDITGMSGATKWKNYDTEQSDPDLSGGSADYPFYTGYSEETVTNDSGEEVSGEYSVGILDLSPEGDSSDAKDPQVISPHTDLEFRFGTSDEYKELIENVGSNSSAYDQDSDGMSSAFADVGFVGPGKTGPSDATYQFKWSYLGTDLTNTSANSLVAAAYDSSYPPMNGEDGAGQLSWTNEAWAGWFDSDENRSCDTNYYGGGVGDNELYPYVYDTFAESAAYDCILHLAAENDYLTFTGVYAKSFYRMSRTYSSGDWKKRDCPTGGYYGQSVSSLCMGPRTGQLTGKGDAFYGLLIAPNVDEDTFLWTTSSVSEWKNQGSLATVSSTL